MKQKDGSKCTRTSLFLHKKWKGLHGMQLLKNNLDNVASILSSFPWNLLSAIHSALFKGMEGNYFSHNHIKILMKCILTEECFGCTFICCNKRVFYILRVKNSWNNNLQSEVFFLNNMKDGFAAIVSIWHGKNVYILTSLTHLDKADTGSVTV